MTLDDAPRDALSQPYAHWLAYHSTACPRCGGPRCSHAGCDYCREAEAARALPAEPASPHFDDANEPTRDEGTER